MSFTEFTRPGPGLQPGVGDSREVAEASRESTNVDRAEQVGTRQSLLGRMWCCSGRPPSAQTEARQTTIGKLKAYFRSCFSACPTSSATGAAGIDRTPSSGSPPDITGGIEQAGAEGTEQVSPRPEGEKPTKGSFERVTPGVPEETQVALAKARDLGGLCCSFAMDWAQRCLEGESFSDGRYTDQSLERIANNQKRYAQAAEAVTERLKTGRMIEEFPLESAAKIYGLKAQEISSWRYTKDESGEWKETGEFQPGVYYIELKRRKGGGEHGFAIDCRDANRIGLTDVGSGTYLCHGMRAGEAAMEHIKLLNDAISKAEKDTKADTRIEDVYIHKLELRTD